MSLWFPHLSLPLALGPGIESNLKIAMQITHFFSKLSYKNLILLVIGGTRTAKLTSNQVRNLEPDIASSCRGAVHIPAEIIVGPFLYAVCCLSVLEGVLS